MDSDGDGTILLQEFQAAHERIFKGMDANKDGRLNSGGDANLHAGNQESGSGAVGSAQIRWTSPPDRGARLGARRRGQEILAGRASWHHGAPAAISSQPCTLRRTYPAAARSNCSRASDCMMEGLPQRDRKRVLGRHAPFLIGDRIEDDERASQSRPLRLTMSWRQS